MLKPEAQQAGRRTVCANPHPAAFSSVAWKMKTTQRRAQPEGQLHDTLCGQVWAHCITGTQHQSCGFSHLPYTVISWFQKREWLSVLFCFLSQHQWLVLFSGLYLVLRSWAKRLQDTETLDAFLIWQLVA